MPKVEFEITENELNKAARSEIKQLNKKISKLESENAKYKDALADARCERSKLIQELNLLKETQDVVKGLKRIMEGIEI